MKMWRYLAVLCFLFVLPLLLTSFIVGKETRNKIKGDVCSASNPASICSSANTCGSVSSSCSIDIKRSQGSWATATPNIPGAKENKAFCIKVGTTVTFMSSSKNTGFLIDFGNSTPDSMRVAASIAPAGGDKWHAGKKVTESRKKYQQLHRVDREDPFYEE
jgi:hypothetical protein